MTSQTFSYLAWEYDIDKAAEVIAETPEREIHRLKVAEWGGLLPQDPTVAKETPGYLILGAIGVNWDAVDRVVTLGPGGLEDNPLIVAESARSKDEPDKAGYMIIDGWHRLARARRDHVVDLPAYVLTLEESEEILTWRSMPLIPDPDPEFTATISASVNVWFDYAAVKGQIHSYTADEIQRDADSVMDLLRALGEGKREFTDEERMEFLAAMRFEVTSVSA